MSLKQFFPMANMNQPMDGDSFNSPNHTLFLGDLSAFCSERDIHELFSPFGEILEIKIMRSEDTQRNLSYGFLKFTLQSNAADALNALNGVLFCGRHLRVGWAAYKNKKEPRVHHYDKMDSASIHVSFATAHLQKSITEETLRQLFSTFGAVLDTSIKKSYFDDASRKLCGYGFIHFSSTPAGMQSALRAVQQLNETSVDDVEYKCSVSHALERRILSQSPHSQQNFNRNNGSVGPNSSLQGPAGRKFANGMQNNSSSGFPQSLHHQQQQQQQQQQRIPQSRQFFGNDFDGISSQFSPLNDHYSSLGSSPHNAHFYNHHQQQQQFGGQQQQQQNSNLFARNSLSNSGPMAYPQRVAFSRPDQSMSPLGMHSFQQEQRWSAADLDLNQMPFSSHSKLPTQSSLGSNELLSQWPPQPSPPSSRSLLSMSFEHQLSATNLQSMENKDKERRVSMHSDSSGSMWDPLSLSLPNDHSFMTNSGKEDKDNLLMSSGLVGNNFNFVESNKSLSSLFPQMLNEE